VNIHPQKTEVKFEDEHLIFALLRSTIKRSLGIYNVSPSLDFDKDPELDEMMNKPIPSKGNGGGGSGVIKMPEIIVDKDYNPFLEEKMLYILKKFRTLRKCTIRILRQNLQRSICLKMKILTKI
jgi:hypothetical protein